MIHRRIVTCFLEIDDKLLLLRRSDKVGTYQGKWASVSGHIEGGEDEFKRALIEIEEETKLKKKDVKLLAKSQPITVTDNNNKVSWKVYPFLFRVLKNNIRIDWEHAEYSWIKPSELAKYDTVPMLNEVYKLLREKIRNKS